MKSLLTRIKANALVCAVLYALLGLVLLIWPEITAAALCRALGAVLALCGLVDIAAFLRRRDGTLYAALLLVVGVALGAVGIWLMVQPSAAASIVPRIAGVLIAVNALENLAETYRLYQSRIPAWKAAGALSLITFGLGIILLFDLFGVLRAAARFMGAFLLCDGASSFWISLQAGRARSASKGRKLPPQDSSAPDNLFAPDENPFYGSDDVK